LNFNKTRINTFFQDGDDDDDNKSRPKTTHFSNKTYGKCGNTYFKDSLVLQLYIQCAYKVRK